MFYWTILRFIFLKRERFKSSSRVSMVSSISTVEPNSLMVLIVEVKLSQKVSLMKIGNMKFIPSLRMMGIVERRFRVFVMNFG